MQEILQIKWQTTWVLIALWNDKSTRRFWSHPHHACGSQTETNPCYINQSILWSGIPIVKGGLGVGTNMENTFLRLMDLQFQKHMSTHPSTYISCLHEYLGPTTIQ